jgi:hypothetical protein
MHLPLSFPSPHVCLPSSLIPCAPPHYFHLPRVSLKIPSPRAHYYPMCSTQLSHVFHSPIPCTLLPIFPHMRLPIFSSLMHPHGLYIASPHYSWLIFPSNNNTLSLSLSLSLSLLVLYLCLVVQSTLWQEQ